MQISVLWQVGWEQVVFVGLHVTSVLIVLHWFQIAVNQSFECMACIFWHYRALSDVKCDPGYYILTRTTLAKADWPH